MLALLKNHLNFLKESIFELIFKKYNKLLFFKKVWVFFITYNDEKSEA